MNFDDDAENMDERLVHLPSQGQTPETISIVPSDIIHVETVMNSEFEDEKNECEDRALFYNQSNSTCKSADFTESSCLQNDGDCTLFDYFMSYIISSLMIVRIANEPWTEVLRVKCRPQCFSCDKRQVHQKKRIDQMVYAHKEPNPVFGKMTDQLPSMLMPITTGRIHTCKIRTDKIELNLFNQYVLWHSEEHQTYCGFPMSKQGIVPSQKKIKMNNLVPEQSLQQFPLNSVMSNKESIETDVDIGIKVTTKKHQPISDNWGDLSTSNCFEQRRLLLSHENESKQKKFASSDDKKKVKIICTNNMNIGADQEQFTIAKSQMELPIMDKAFNVTTLSLLTEDDVDYTSHHLTLMSEESSEKRVFTEEDSVFRNVKFNVNLPSRLNISSDMESDVTVTKSKRSIGQLPDTTKTSHEKESMSKVVEQHETLSSEPSETKRESCALNEFRKEDEITCHTTVVNQEFFTVLPAPKQLAIMEKRGDETSLLSTEVATSYKHRITSKTSETPQKGLFMEEGRSDIPRTYLIDVEKSKTDLRPHIKPDSIEANVEFSNPIKRPQSEFNSNGKRHRSVEEKALRKERKAQRRAHREERKRRLLESKQTGLQQKRKSNNENVESRQEFDLHERNLETKLNSKTDSSLSEREIDMDDEKRKQSITSTTVPSTKSLSAKISDELEKTRSSLDAINQARKVQEKMKDINWEKVTLQKNELAYPTRKGSAGIQCETMALNPTVMPIATGTDLEAAVYDKLAKRKLSMQPINKTSHGEKMTSHVQKGYLVGEISNTQTEFTVERNATLPQNFLNTASQRKSIVHDELEKSYISMNRSEKEKPFVEIPCTRTRVKDAPTWQSDNIFQRDLIQRNDSMTSNVLPDAAGILTRMKDHKIRKNDGTIQSYGQRISPSPSKLINDKKVDGITRSDMYQRQVRVNSTKPLDDKHTISIAGEGNVVLQPDNNKRPYQTQTNDENVFERLDDEPSNNGTSNKVSSLKKVNVTESTKGIAMSQKGCVDIQTIEEHVFHLPCSEDFFEAWGFVIEELACGSWANTTTNTERNNQDENPPSLISNRLYGTNTTRNGEQQPKLRQKIILHDTSLVDACGVAIELPGRVGMIVFRSSLFANVVEARRVVLEVATLISIGRYTILYIILCYDVQPTPLIVNNIVLLQCATLGMNDKMPPTETIIKTTSEKVISFTIGKTILRHVQETTKSKRCWKHMELITEYMSNDHNENNNNDEMYCVRAQFLLSLLPTLSACGAIECLLRAKDAVPTGSPFFKLLFQNERLRQRILLAATSSVSSSVSSVSVSTSKGQRLRNDTNNDDDDRKQSLSPCEIHPFAMIQLSRVMMVSFTEAWET